LTPRCSVKQSGHPIAIHLSKSTPSALGRGEHAPRYLRDWWR